MKLKNKKICVGILMGGKSSEHRISIMSGNKIADFLGRKKYSSVKLIVTKNNKWKRDGRKMSIEEAFRNIDVVFNAMHGEFGEDGKVQGILDFYGVPYTGSGVLGSVLGINKTLSKQLFGKVGLTVPKQVSVDKNNYDERIVSIIKKFDKKGAVIKPNSRGSSMGMTVLKSLNKKNITVAIKRAFDFDDEVIVEEYLRGREFSCGVLEDWKSVSYFALPVVEIITGDESIFFDYKAKYFSSNTREIVPAKISRKIVKKIQRAAILAHKIIKAQGYSRSDFILKGGKIYLLEINTLPGMTEASLFPKEAKAVGIEFSELIDHIIGLAINK